MIDLKALIKSAGADKPKQTFPHRVRQVNYGVMVYTENNNDGVITVTPHYYTPADQQMTFIAARDLTNEIISRGYQAKTISIVECE